MLAGASVDGPASYSLDEDLCSAAKPHVEIQASQCLTQWPVGGEKWLGLLGQVLGFLKWIPCGLRLSTVLLAEGPSRP
jgi:hypothetical protein